MFKIKGDSRLYGQEAQTKKEETVVRAIKVKKVGSEETFFLGAKFDINDDKLNINLGD